MNLMRRLETERTWPTEHVDQLRAEAKRIETLFCANGHTAELFPDIFSMPVRFDVKPTINLLICSDLAPADCADLLRRGGYLYYTEYGRAFPDHMQCNLDEFIFDLHIMHRTHPYIENLKEFWNDCLLVAEFVEYNYIQRNSMALNNPNAEHSYFDILANKIESTLQLRSKSKQMPRQWIAELMISTKTSVHLKRILEEYRLSLQEFADSSYAFALFRIDMIREKAKGKIPLQILREYPVYAGETKEQARNNDQRCDSGGYSVISLTSEMC